MGVAYGIGYQDLTNTPGVTLTADTFEGDGNAPYNWDDYTYAIDTEVLEAQGLTHADTITITGDWHRGDNLDRDGYGSPDGGEYFHNVLAGAPMPGSFTLDSVSGAFEWTVSIADLVDYAIDQSIINMRFSGDYAAGASDADKFKIVITCFLPGTMIATPAGEAAIETLTIGDTIRTADGREVAVKWVGRKTMQASVFMDDTMLPVRVAAGAFGNGLPVQDLYLSANHGIIMDGMLVNAGAMVNDDTIRFVALAEMPGSFTYYHIETEAHDEILANGVPVETFIDYVGRKGFDNYDEYVSAYGADRLIPEMKRMRVSSRRQLPQLLRERLGVASFTEAVTGDLNRFLARAA